MHRQRVMYENPWRECRLLECETKVYLKGFCSYHYDKNRKDAKKCAAPHCLKNSRKSGLCYKHGNRAIFIKCRMPGCKESNYSKGLCQGHTQQLKRCYLDDCKKDVYCKKLCKTHYNRRVWEKRKKVIKPASTLAQIFS